MLKVLIGVASIAVIAAVGYYFMQEYNDHAAISSALEFQRKCRGTLVIASTRDWTDDETRTVAECVVAGQLTREEMFEAISTMPPGQFTFEHYGDPSTKPELK